MSVRFDVKSLHVIERDGLALYAPLVIDAGSARPGDVVEVECIGGFVPAVDPRTYKALPEHQRFRIDGDGKSLKPVKIERMDIRDAWKRLRP